MTASPSRAASAARWASLTCDPGHPTAGREQKALCEQQTMVAFGTAVLTRITRPSKDRQRSPLLGRQGSPWRWAPRCSPSLGLELAPAASGAPASPPAESQQRRDENSPAQDNLCIIPGSTTTNNLRVVSLRMCMWLHTSLTVMFLNSEDSEKTRNSSISLRVGLRSWL